MSLPLPMPSLILIKRKFYIDHKDYHHFSRTRYSRRRVICRECMGLKQRRRDEIRDGYRCLKGALPISNQKPTEVSLLNRATTHIKYLETAQQQFQTRLQQAENEISRLRQCVDFLSNRSIAALKRVI
jgi:Helix-loop-helix DNA-binding domain